MQDYTALTLIVHSFQGIFIKDVWKSSSYLSENFAFPSFLSCKNSYSHRCDIIFSWNSSFSHPTAVRLLSATKVSLISSETLTSAKSLKKHYTMLLIWGFDWRRSVDIMHIRAPRDCSVYQTAFRCADMITDYKTFHKYGCGYENSIRLQLWKAVR